MTTIDPVTGLGAGTFGYCPCTMTLDGRPEFTYVGHSGGTTILRYAATDDLVISINLSGSVWTTEMVQATADFFEMARAIVRNHDAIAHPQAPAQTEPTAPAEPEPAAPEIAPSTEPSEPAAPETTTVPAEGESSDGD